MNYIEKNGYKFDIPYKKRAINQNILQFILKVKYYSTTIGS